MASITLGGNPIHTSGELPKVGSKLADFKLVKNDLSVATLSDFAGKKLVLNIFPSIDTGTCATSVRKFNESASNLENTEVLCISRDLPFAQKRFCGAEGLENVVNLSDFNEGSFGKNNGLEIVDGPLAGLHSRVIIVVDENGTITHTEQVAEIARRTKLRSCISSTLIAYLMEFQKDNTFVTGRLKSVTFAFKGAVKLITTEHSIMVQFSLGILMTIAGFYFGITSTEWLFQTLAIGLVMSIEGLNTAVEKIADFIHPNYHERIGFIKDIAAGAVFFAALTAIAIGLIIYIPIFIIGIITIKNGKNNKNSSFR